MSVYFRLSRAFVRLGIALVAALGAGALSMPSASAQNFFQQLFGGGQQERPTYQGRSSYSPGPQRGFFAGLPGFGSQEPRSRVLGTLDPSDPALRQEMRRRAARGHGPRHEHAGAEGGGTLRGRQAAISPTPDAPNGSIALFMKDRTLRAGDVVVTNAGFRVYEGHGAARPADFVAINSAGGAKGNRTTLTELEKASRMKTPNVTVETVALAKPVIEPPVDEKTKGKKGKSLAQNAPKGTRTR